MATPSGGCQSAPAGWTTYTVRSGNTLFSIALAVGSTVNDLRIANCILNIDNIRTGQVLFVPQSPSGPVQTLVPSTITSNQNVKAIGCTRSGVQITSPIPLQRIKGVFTIYGTAKIENFAYYKIEVRPDINTIYNFYLDSRSWVENDVLGLINSEIFDNGLHWVRLSVVDTAGRIQPDAVCDIPVIFD